MSVDAFAAILSHRAGDRDAVHDLGGDDLQGRHPWFGGDGAGVDGGRLPGRPWRGDLCGGADLPGTPAHSPVVGQLPGRNRHAGLGSGHRIIDRRRPESRRTLLVDLIGCGCNGPGIGWFSTVNGMLRMRSSLSMLERCKDRG